ncbi:MAG: hydantoinase/carbamoylase family amidase [Rhodospirillaceae bacterium]|jgi:beta-ureidopropionase / N-carbamoyl-L-amino-acid hydrolase|nr:hydantoinase/carbamoylase family amidase [Rhodospirillaceae bacterium]MBT5896593.1 hydantoinase/carbamoylase family amidase [Rhodospirillaceae bacterium]MBT6426118.1 hydantoinase/carbamoylase family amidase [Rhodospirillaceae bacterium]
MTKVADDALRTAVTDLMPLASEIFDDIRTASLDDEGVTRPAWSEQDQAAADILLMAARAEGLATRQDAIGNAYADLEGSDPTAPAILSGSHLDSVARGGNFDGLAGAVAAVIALAAVRRTGIVPGCRLTAMGTRCEESVWYGIAYVGARLAVGAMERSEFDNLVRLDSKHSIADHMADQGLRVDEIWQGDPIVTATNTKAFLELHIEQGPLLVEQDAPLAVATAIRGNLRHGDGVCHGAYQHSAATPRRLRQDTVLAVTELLGRLEALWHEIEDSDDPSAVFTVGKLFTDPDHHALTKVPGECHFSLNFGSTEQHTLDRARDAIAALTEDIARRRNVRFVLGDAVGSSPTPLDLALRAKLHDNADRRAIPCQEFATVGHDASIFARAGIPAAVLLVRNADGSHNPDEKMAMADFEQGVQVLAATMVELAGS